MKVKRLKLKKIYIDILKVLFFIFIVLIALFIFYRFEINSIKYYGYSEKASYNILINFKKDYIIKKNNNKTLNAAFESDNINLKYLSKYSNIDFYPGDNFIRNINLLIEKKYTISDINLILSRGNEEDVYNFSKRDKVNYLEEYLEYDFSKLKYYDEYIKYADEVGENAYTVVVHVNSMINKEGYKDYVVVNEHNKLMLVNKHFKLDNNYFPSDLVLIDKKYTNGKSLKMNKEAYNNYIKMYEDGKNASVNFYITSAYRSAREQEQVFNYYKNLYGQSYVDKNIFLPRFSENETGYAIDLSSANGNIFGNSNEYKWVRDNAYKYGFILRYPNKFYKYNGVNGNAWHYRYVGVKAATYIHNNNISFEQYYVIFVDKN